jgi:hypothetical protein
MAHKTALIPVGKLLLDTDNPRHEPVQSQRDAILALIATERQKLVVLANDIAENGLSPTDRLLVIPDGRNFTVVEGNRRLAAIRLLNNPAIADHTAIAAAIKLVAKDATVPGAADCSIVTDRDEAEHWMILRHRGEAAGAGVVRWDTFASNRFSHKPGSQAAKAIRFLATITAGYPKNTVIQELAQRVAEELPTTLGRLVSDPNLVSRVGLVDEDGAMTFHYPAEALEAFMEHLLGDLAADVTVSQLKSKPQRAKYLAGTPKPDQNTRTALPTPLSKQAVTAPTKKPAAKPKPVKPARPFQLLNLENLSSKTQALLREFTSLDPDKVPNAAAVLTRAILELSVDEYIERKGLKPTDSKLRKRVEACLRNVDRKYDGDQYQALRTGLQDGSSLYAVATLHAFVHNRHYHADGTTVRSIAENITPFLQALNDRV